MPLKSMSAIFIGSVILLAWTRPSVSETKTGAKCLEYAPALVTLSGSLVMRTFSGPPNYDNTQKGDKPETTWLIDLSEAVCVDKDSVEPELNPGQNAVREIQLVLSPDQYARHKILVGRKVIARGTLFGQNAGHHHTAVLLTVRTLEESRK